MILYPLNLILKNRICPVSFFMCVRCAYVYTCMFYNYYIVYYYIYIIGEGGFRFPALMLRVSPLVQPASPSLCLFWFCSIGLTTWTLSFPAEQFFQPPLLHPSSVPGPHLWMAGVPESHVCSKSFWLRQGFGDPGSLEEYRLVVIFLFTSAY